MQWIKRVSVEIQREKKRLQPFICDAGKLWLAATQTGHHVPPDGKGQK